jgi:hypothetical protein
MKSLVGVCAVIAAALSLSAAAAKAATFTSLAAFQAAVPDAVLMEDFESRGPANTQLLSVLGTNQKFQSTLAAGSHDLIIAANGHANFDIPGGKIDSQVLISMFSEAIRDTFTTADHLTAAPVHAIGFDAYLTNSFTTTIRFFGANPATTIATLTFSPDNDPNNNLQFVGFTSDLDIGGFDFTTNGTDDFHNSGIDNIYALPHGQLLPAGGVPEPASWAMMIGGLGLAGMMLRSRRKLAAATA